MSSDGGVHGGAMVSVWRDVEQVVPLWRGPQDLTIWASATDVDGEPAQVGVTLDDVLVATLDVKPTTLDFPSIEPLHATFDVPDTGFHSLRIVFQNDKQTESADRNLRLSAVRLTALTPPTPAQRETWMREQLAHANILLISVDSLRRDAISPPAEIRWDRSAARQLADNGSTFTSAWSTSHWTLPAHASLLSSLYPQTHGALSELHPERMPDEVETLAELLRDNGYATAGFAGGFWVSPRFGLGQGFSTWHGDSDWKSSIHDAQHRTADALAWLDQRKDTASPFFALVHYYQVHSPYGPAEDEAQARFPQLTQAERHAAAMPFTGPLPTPSDLRVQRSLYESDVETTDQSIHDLLSGLTDRGLLDSTLVILTSDHGEEFFEHGWVGHGQLYSEVTGVPLILSHPALKVAGARSIPRPVSLIDVAPTVLDMLGLDAPNTWQGTSLLPDLAGSPPAPSFVALGALTDKVQRAAIIACGKSLIVDGGRHELYDLSADPSQHLMLASSEGAFLEAELASWAGSLGPIGIAEPADFDPEVKDMLKAIGYLATP